jgi:hypothetical protein
MSGGEKGRIRRQAKGEVKGGKGHTRIHEAEGQGKAGSPDKDEKILPICSAREQQAVRETNRRKLLFL